jgi:regulator of nucleoside diphosphate kinase
MSDREIFITDGDMQRLSALVRAGAADDRERPYLAALQRELDSATIVAPDAVPADVVTMNSRVKLRDGRRTWMITLVYPEDADAESGRISVLAPLGAAVLGCCVGRPVQFRVPGGELRRCDILSVDFQPEAAAHQRSA